jgi:hypothetical protein
MRSTNRHNGFGFNGVNRRPERRPVLGSDRGFVLVVAVLGTAILLAVGILALTMSGQDIRISSRVVGDKKAFFACESGLHQLITNFDPVSLGGSAVLDPYPVDYSNDPASCYTIATPSHPSSGPGTLPLAGYSIGGGQVWGQTVYDATVTGTNTDYGSRAQVSVGLGYGPVDMSTTYR